MNNIKNDIILFVCKFTFACSFIFTTLQKFYDNISRDYLRYLKLLFFDNSRKE